MGKIQLFEKKHKLALGCGYVLYPLAKCGSTLLLASLFSQVFALITNSKNQRQFLSLVAINLLLVAGCIFLMVISKCIIQIFLNKAIIGLKKNYVTHLQNMSLKELQGQHSGHWLSILEKDIQKVETFLGTTMIQSVLPIVIGGVCIISIFLKTWQIGMVVLILSVSSQIVNKYYGKKHRYYQQTIAEEEEKIQECETDCIAGEETIRVYQLKSFVLDKVEKLFCKVNEKEDKYLEQRTLHYFISGILGSLTMLTPIVYGMLLVSKGEYEISEIMYSVQLCGNVGWFLGSIASSIEEISKYKVSYNRIKHVIEIEEDRSSLIEKKGTNYVLRAEKWSVGYGEIKVIDEINFQVEKGKYIVIVGKSGNGKSTLLKGIKGLAMSTGKLSCDFDNRKSQREVFGSEIIYIPQNVELFEDSFLNILTYWKKIDMEEIELCCKRCCIHDFIQKQPQGYETMIRERGSNLSGGQRQRLAIARALLKKPQVLLLDESTSALDEKTEKQLFKNIREAYPQMTILSVTHRLGEMENADEVWKVENSNLEIMSLN
ncbi:ABC transporter ATP-binding protein [Blautia sp. Marseille-P3201T]|uniref:ABC transporter ATP-binding protein n=1 Tax=Blautia sp. Marseille-P3201T TaxID=1907659 RepID=UPI000931FA26|nr:ABC transporter ATP-binding protein [Blautia sp. Marseille-P3201T]